MTLMRIRLELGRSADMPAGDRSHGYEFVAPIDADGHLDADHWEADQIHCGVRSFRRGTVDRHGMLHRTGQGWRFDYGQREDGEDMPLFRLDKHVIAPGLCLTIGEEDGARRPFRIVSVRPINTHPGGI